MPTRPVLPAELEFSTQTAGWMSSDGELGLHTTLPMACEARPSHPNQNVSPHGRLHIVAPHSLSIAARISSLHPRPAQDAQPSQRAKRFRGARLPPGVCLPVGPHIPARPTQTPPRPQDDWRQWVELSIKIRGLQTSVSTLDLWRGFSKYGSLDMIEIFESKRGLRDGTARIRYRPPPTNPFWEQVPFQLKGPTGENTLLELNLENKKRSFLAPSPVHPLVRFPEQMVLLPISMDFGSMFSMSTMMTMFRVTRQRHIGIAFELNLLRKLIDIQFQLDISLPTDQSAEKRPTSSRNKIEQYRFRIPLAQLQRVHTTRDGNSCAIIISLDTPPNYYRKMYQVETSHEEDSRYWTEWDCWYRQTDIVHDQRGLAGAALALKKVMPIIDIGKWTTYRFVFDSENNQRAYEVILSVLRDFNIEVLPFEGFNMITHRQPAVWEWIDKPSTVKNDSGSFLADLEEAVVPLLSFPVRYQLEVCISQGCLNEYNLTSEFVDKLASMDEKNARDLLEHVADSKSRVFDPMALFNVRAIQGPHSGVKIPYYCIYTRKATITPSTIYYSTPTVETSNRVIRQYVEHADRFLRVQFSDEKFQGRINATEKLTNNEVFTRVKRAMTNGINIGDRHFEFLAFGNSQFREHGAYFFAPTQHLQAADIRQWMGEFSDIRVIAKHAARLGQCFSTTRAINGARVEVKEIPDIIRNGYTFTDGVGKISEFLAQLIASELDLGMPSNPPSVFQFRLGGCKGILAISPDARHREIHIRPSQYKFPAVHNGLEIIRWSQYAAATLNRQLILVLSALGVPDHVFVTKLREMMSNLERAMWNPEIAFGLLCKNIDPNQMTITIAGLIRDGFMRAKEPFFLSLLQLWRAWSIKYLKERAKILIDKGAFVLGCVDETATLKGHYDRSSHGHNMAINSVEQQLEALPEIFIQVPDREKKGKYVVIEGICLLARNPSLHPGDIRVAKAVNVPALHHMRDVVVLPQMGDRDIASMCSGGDLDGDDYLVVWDKDLTPKEWNHESMDYTPPNTRKLGRDVGVNDITSFFVTYMKNDRLPTIAHAHLGWADRLDAGVKDEKCLRLAALHSQAVDYVKTGEPARMPKDLRVRMWPHFMEKTWVPQDQIYISGKVLGQLYDQVERLDFVPQYEYKFDDRVLDAYELSDDILRRAQIVKQQYDQAMRRIMGQHDIATEFEVFSTFVLRHASMSKDYKFHEEMGQISQSLKDRFRKECIIQAGGKDFSNLGPFVAAMYTVTRQQVTLALHECRQKRVIEDKEVSMGRLDAKSMPLMSFPWIFIDIMGKIANERPSSSTKDAIKRQDMPPDAMRGNKKTSKGGKVHVDDDVVETAEGLTRRGELLQLFHHSDESTKVSQAFVPDEVGLVEGSLDRDSGVGVGDVGVSNGLRTADKIGTEGSIDSIDLEKATSGDVSSKEEVQHGATVPDCPPWHEINAQEQETIPRLRHGVELLQASNEKADADLTAPSEQSALISLGNLLRGFSDP